MIMENYIPPYEITNAMVELVGEIMENLGKLTAVDNLSKLPKLRRISRIKSIHSSLAIENNTLSVEQVTDVINGKRVLAPKKDIEEVQNAFKAYELLGNIDAFNLNDLLKVHGIMMNGLVKEAGQLRTGQVGVYNQNGKVVHLAPPAEFVPIQLNGLFKWINESNSNMLIKSSIFHYEFEFIHPFNDGNGRMGRFWQTALLASWKPIFEWLPIESIIKDNQQDYYNAISLSTSQGKSNAFIMFMLNVINKVIKEVLIDSKNHLNHLSNQIDKLMKVIDYYPQSATELMQKLKLKSKLSFRKNYLKPALTAGLISMTEPNKPTSKNQKYFKV